MDKRTVKDIQLTGKRVLVRVDYNVPMNDKGEITDVIRIEASLPTLHYLLDQGAAVILLAHLGRPKGKVNMKYTLKPVAEALSQLIHRPVQFCPDCIGKEAQAAAAQLRNGDILLLENLRGAGTRAAHFHTSVVCCFPNGDVLEADGDCHGTIAYAPQGENGFGYDPVFFVPELRKTFAQLTPEEKNAISHRGVALRAFGEKLKEYMENH